MKEKEIIIDAITNIKDAIRDDEAEVTQLLLDIDANSDMPEGVNLNEDEDTGHLDEYVEMSEDELLQEVNNQLSNSVNGLDDDDDVEISTPLDAFYGRIPGLTKSQIEDTNASRYVSRDVAMGIDSTLAELSPLFSVEEIVKFTAVNEADENQAQQETELLNDIFFNEYSGYTLLQRALKDCLLHRNANAKVYWEEKQKVVFEEYENIVPQILPQILQPQTPNETVEVVEQSFDESNPEQTIISIKVKRVKQVSKPAIQIIKPEDLVVSSSHEGPTLKGSKFSAFRHEIFQSELIEAGYDEDLVYKIPEYNRSNETYSRQRTTDDYDYYSSTFDKLVRIYECYLTIDFDGDGIAELRKIVTDGTNLLSNETIEYNELVSGVTKISPHNHQGISMFDDLWPIQQSKTSVMRSIIDGTKLSSNPRIGVVTESVNVDDVLTSRTGGIVRMKNPNGIVPLPSGEVPQTSFQFIEFMDSIRRDLGGASIDTAASAAQSVGATATAVSLAMGAVEAQNIILARTFAETFIRDLFQTLHTVVRLNHPGQITAKIKGKWITQTPSEWQERSSLVVTLGGGKTDKANKLNGYNNILMNQEKLAANNSSLFNENKLYNALAGQAKLVGIRDAEEFYVDPNSQEGQEANQRKEQLNQQASEEQKQIQQQMAQAQQQLSQAEMLKANAQMTNAQADFKVSQVEAQLTAIKEGQQLSFDYYKAELDASTKIAIAQMQDETKSNMDYEKLMNDIFKTTNKGI